MSPRGFNYRYVSAHTEDDISSGTRGVELLESYRAQKLYLEAELLNFDSENNPLSADATVGRHSSALFDLIEDVMKVARNSADIDDERVYSTYEFKYLKAKHKSIQLLDEVVRTIDVLAHFEPEEADFLRDVFIRDFDANIQLNNGKYYRTYSNASVKRYVMDSRCITSETTYYNRRKKAVALFAEFWQVLHEGNMC